MRLYRSVASCPRTEQRFLEVWRSSRGTAVARLTAMSIIRSSLFALAASIAISPPARASEPWDAAKYGPPPVHRITPNVAMPGWSEVNALDAELPAFERMFGDMEGPASCLISHGTQWGEISMVTPNKLRTNGSIRRLTPIGARVLSFAEGAAMTSSMPGSTVISMRCFGSVAGNNVAAASGKTVLAWRGIIRPHHFEGALFPAADLFTPGGASAVLTAQETTAFVRSGGRYLPASVLERLDPSLAADAVRSSDVPAWRRPPPPSRTRVALARASGPARYVATKGGVLLGAVATGDGVSSLITDGMEARRGTLHLGHGAALDDYAWEHFGELDLETQSLVLLTRGARKVPAAVGRAIDAVIPDAISAPANSAVSSVWLPGAASDVIHQAQLETSMIQSARARNLPGYNHDARYVPFARRPGSRWNWAEALANWLAR